MTEKTEAEKKAEAEAAEAAKPAVNVSPDGNAAHIGGEEKSDGEITPMPDGGAEKFYNKDTGAYDWQAHAKEAEFKAEQAAKKSEKPAEGEGEGEGEDAVKNAVEAAGLSLDAIDDKIMKNGDIDESDYAALEKIGFSRERVKSIVDMTAADYKSQATSIADAFGGEKALNDAVAWADANLTQAEIDKIDEQVTDPDTREAAIAGLRAKMGLAPAAKGPSLKSGDNAPPPGGEGATPFASQAEVVEAIRDKRYKTDPAYRADVEKRVAASNYQLNPRAHVGR